MKEYEIRKTVLSILFSLVAIACGNKVVANGRSHIIYYSDKEGLPRNIVSSFISDKYGYGWVGTGNGVARFDGYNFVTYEKLKGRTINSLSLATNDKLWVGSDKGLFIYNRFTDSFQLIGEGYIKELINYKGYVYYMLANKLVKLNPNLEIKEYVINKLNAFAVTEEGIWFNAGNSGVKLLDSLPKW
jgi:ligand-binding sensor domain-containing protein